MTNLQTAQVAVAPDVIDFGIGQPGFSLLPLELMRRAASHRLEQEERAFLQYGVEEGDGYFRVALAHFLSQNDHGAVAPEQLFITSGASQALDLLCTLLAQPGDTVFVEEPTYFLALRIFADHRLNVVGIPTDEQGMLVEALAEQLQRRRPAFVYTIPTFQNPTSATMPLERRRRLVELSQQHGCFIIADEVYQLLGYHERPPATLGSFVDSGRVFSLGSFSKILAPGLRLGWVQTSPALVERLAGSGLLQSGGGLNPFTSALVRSALEQGWQREYLDQLRAIYTRRSAVMSQALREHMPAQVRYREPAGGFFFWLALPEQLDAAQLLVRAERDERVRFQPGVKFSGAGSLRHYLRLSFAFYDEPLLQEGIARLARAVRDERP